MTKRKGISKKHRFEVLKRDSFTCQYCGANPAATLLEVDHIQPVAKGGGNDMLNLITSCFDCNRGKSARELSDDSVVVKQKTQLDNLQARRQQLEMMLEWRKGLDGLKSETNLMVIEYIESKIKPYTISDFGKKKLERVLNKYVLEEVLEAVTVAESRYLRYGDDEVLEQSSVANFITKITGTLVNSKRSPVDQKVAYILGICRNRFGYENHKTDASLLKKMQLVMNNAGRTDELVLKFLTDKIQPMAIEAANWTQWKEKVGEFLETLKEPPTNDVPANAVRHPQENDREVKSLDLVMKEMVDECIEILNRSTPDIVSAGSGIELRSEPNHYRLCTGVLNYFYLLEEFYVLGIEQCDFPNLFLRFEEEGIVLLQESICLNSEFAYQKLLEDLCEKVESVVHAVAVKEEQDDVMASQFYAIANYFHSKKYWPSNDELWAETPSNETILRRSVDFFIDVINRLTPALIYTSEQLGLKDSQLIYQRLCTGSIYHLEALKEFYDEPVSGREYPKLLNFFDEQGMVVKDEASSSLLGVYEGLLDDICTEYYTILQEMLNEEHSPADFEFMAVYFQSQIKSSSLNDWSVDAASVPHAEGGYDEDDCSITQERLHNDVDEVLLMVEERVPALHFIARHYQDIDELDFRRLIYQGIQNYYFGFWVQLGSISPISLTRQNRVHLTLRNELSKLGIFSMFDNIDNYLDYGLEQAYSHLLDDLKDRVKISLTPEACKFIIELFHKRVGLKLTELRDKQTESEAIEKKSEKPELDTNLIKFPVRD
jgi:hypothetical protein